MNSLEETFLPVKEACLSAAASASTSDSKVKVFHLHKSDSSLNRYIVWAESLEDSSIHSDNEKTNCKFEGTVDLYSKIEYDPVFDLLQTEFNNRNIDFYLNSTQYELETEFIHHEWVVRVDG